MAVLLLYGVLGGLGDSTGFLSEHTTRLPNGYIKYLSRLRVEKSFQTSILVDDTVKDFRLAINNDYIQKIRITQIIPEPQEVTIRDKQIVYRFSTLGAGTITLFCDPRKMGNQRLEVDVNGIKTSLSQYIFF